MEEIVFILVFSTFVHRSWWAYLPLLESVDISEDGKRMLIQNLWTIMTAQGALERKQNGRQVGQKMKARMQKSYWVHNAPVGNRYKTINGHGKLLIADELLVSHVIEAMEGFAMGRF